MDIATQRSHNLYVFFACSFVSLLLLTNLIGTKLFVFLPNIFPEGIAGSLIVLTSGIITYPFTFLLTDVVSEIWGKKKADYMVFLGFLISIFMLCIIYLAKILPPAEAWQIDISYASIFHPQHYIYNEAGKAIAIDKKAAQGALTFIFDAPSLLLFASMLAYLCAQLVDNFLFHKIRKLTANKHLWLRNNGSTFFSQLLDTVIVNSIFLHFYWKLPWIGETGEVSILKIIITTYICKISIAMIDTPLIYLFVNILKKLGLPLRENSQEEKP